MPYRGRFFAIYSDGTSALAASERELAGLRGDRTEAVAGHAEALDADPELLAAFERASETPEARGERLASATVDELAAELLAGGDRAAVVEAIATKASAEKAEIEADKIESEKATDPKAVRTLSGALVAEEPSMLAPPPPPDKPVERQESSLARAWRRGVWEQPWPIKLLALGIIGATTAGLGLALLATVGVVDDGTEGPTWVGSVATDGVICPSMAAVPREPERWAAGALDLQTEAGWLLEAPSAVVGPCDGPPPGGVTQIRLRGDLVEGYPDDPTREAVAVTFRAGGTGPVLSAVVYADPGASWCAVRHELAHAQLGLGLPTPERPDGHATAATSILHGSAHGEGDATACGDSWDLLLRSLYPEVPDASP